MDKAYNDAHSHRSIETIEDALPEPVPDPRKRLYPSDSGVALEATLKSSENSLSFEQELLDPTPEQHAARLQVFQQHLMETISSSIHRKGPSLEERQYAFRCLTQFSGSSATHETPSPFLSRFLYARRHILSNAITLFWLHIAARVRFQVPFPQIVCDVDPSLAKARMERLAQVNKIHQEAIVPCIKENNIIYDKQGHVVWRVAPRKVSKMSHIEVDTLFADVILSLDEAMANEQVMLRGIAVVESFEDMHWNDYAHLLNQLGTSLPLIVKLFSSMPIRVKAFYLIDTPGYFGFFHRMVLPFLGAKLRSRIHLVVQRERLFNEFIDTTFKEALFSM